MAVRTPERAVLGYQSEGQQSGRSVEAEHRLCCKAGVEAPGERIKFIRPPLLDPTRCKPRTAIEIQLEA